MKIAIYGSSGRLGIEFCNFCLQKNLDFVALVRSENSAKKFDKNINYSIFKNEDELKKAIKDCDVLVNLSGSYDFSKSYNELYEANVLATKKILQAAPEGLKKFIHISSIAVYKSSPGFVINEKSLKEPSSIYGKTKLLGQLEVEKYKNKFNIIILQPAMIYGPNFREGFYEVLNLISKNKMFLVGDGSNHIPLIFYSDVLQAIFNSIKYSNPSASEYILIKQPQLTQKELFVLAAELLNAKKEFKSIPIFLAKALAATKLIKNINLEMINQLSSDRLFDGKKAKKELFFEPKVDFKEGINKVINSWFKNPNNKSF
jgi:nucleoside-diphosphate-sugar epimerase